MTRLVVVGRGELGRALAGALEVAAADHGFDVAAWSPSRPGAWASVEDVVRGAAVVHAAVPSAAAAEVATRCGPLLAPGALYVDLSSTAPAIKQAAAAAMPDYVDAAVLGTVAVSGAAVPIAAAGPAAQRWHDLVAPAGLRVTVLPGAAGDAARLKLVRSVYMKGRDALVLEMLLAARNLGLDDAVVASIGGPGEAVAFGDLVERIVTGLGVHSERRAAELRDAAAVLEHDAGIDPLVTRAAEQRLARLAELGLREQFGGERPARAADVLARVPAERSR